MTTPEILAACRQHGAKAVSDAAYAAMEGRRAAIVALGLGELRNLDLYRATTLAYALMSEEDQAADLTHAAIKAASLP